MPLQNRVQPDGTFLPLPNRGTMMGNRGILHDDDQLLGVARWRHKAWVCCVLSFKGRKRTLMAPGNYTELFFLDEAVALAAGHRPCAECRRADYLAYVDGWEKAVGTRPRAPQMDAALHPARITRQRKQVTFQANARDLPDGCFIHDGQGPALLWQGAALPYTPAGYGPAVPAPTGTVTVLTPRPSVDVMEAGYRPQLHPSANSLIS